MLSLDALCYKFTFVCIFCFSLLLCFLAIVFKCLFFVTFLHRLTFFNFVYTHYLSFTSIAVFDAASFYKQTISRLFSQRLNGSSSICSNFMPYCIPSQLAVTVKSDTCTKTVWADIDSGAESSYINYTLAKELNVYPSKVIIYANEISMFVNIEIGKPNGNPFTKIKLELTSISFGENQNKKVHSLFSRIANVLNIPMFDVPEKDTEKLLIGTDLIPSLLYSSPTFPNRCISLASNLNLIETRLGYYIQGTQFNSDIDFCHNWSYSLTYYFDQHIVIACLLITVLILTIIAILLTLY